MFNYKAIFMIAAAGTLAVSCSDDDNMIPVSEDTSLPVVLPETGEKVLFACDFQDDASDKFVTYDLDSLQPSSDMKQLGFSVGKPWIFTFQDSYTSENFFAGSTSSYAPAGQADDWLVIKDAIHIPSTGYRLTWNSQSLFLDKKDCLKIYISTTGNNPKTDFTDAPVFAVEEEESGETENTDNEWTSHEVSLDKYKGQNIWIAFVNESNDKGVLCLDDILVSRFESFSLVSQTAQYSTSGEIAVKGTITATDKAITSFKAYYQQDGKEGYGQEFKDVNLQPGESLEFTISQPMGLGNEGEYTHYTFWAESDENTVLLKDSTAHVGFEPQHKVVLEEATGMWCGYCPLGILAIEHLQETYPDNFIAIAVHNKDEMAVAAYDAALGFNSFPGGLVNRKINATPTTNDYLLEGAGTFYNAVASELTPMPEAEIRISSATQNSDNTVSINTGVRFALSAKTNDYRTAYVVTVNNYVSYDSGQSNYLAATDRYPTFGKFGKGGEYGQATIIGMPFNDVACGIFPSFKGKQGALPESPALNETYEDSMTISLADCQNITDRVEIEVVALLINGATGEIVNADKVKL